MRSLCVVSSVATALAGILFPLELNAHERGAGGRTDSAATEFNIRGYARPICRMPPPETPVTTNARFHGNNIFIKQLVDTTFATVNPSKVSLNFKQVMCNYKSYITISSANAGMKRVSGSGSAVGGTFLDRIDYNVTASWGSVQIPSTTFSGTTTKASIPANGANLADLVITIETAKGTIPVLEGHYSDALTIKVGSAY